MRKIAYVPGDVNCLFYALCASVYYLSAPGVCESPLDPQQIREKKADLVLSLSDPLECPLDNYAVSRVRASLQLDKPT